MAGRSSGNAPSSKTRAQREVGGRRGLPEVIEQGLEDGFLVAEVVVDAAGGRAGALRDVADAGGPISLAREQGERSIQQAPTGSSRSALPAASAPEYSDGEAPPRADEYVSHRAARRQAVHHAGRQTAHAAGRGTPARDARRRPSPRRRQLAGRLAERRVQEDRVVAEPVGARPAPAPARPRCDVSVSKIRVPPSATASAVTNRAACGARAPPTSRRRSPRTGRIARRRRRGTAPIARQARPPARRSTRPESSATATQTRRPRSRRAPSGARSPRTSRRSPRALAPAARRPASPASTAVPASSGRISRTLFGFVVASSSAHRPRMGPTIARCLSISCAMPTSASSSSPAERVAIERLGFRGPLHLDVAAVARS